MAGAEATSTRFLFVRTTWQPVYYMIYAADAGVIGERIIIDIDHWRNYFLILGALWGLMAATNHAGGAAGRSVARVPSN
jgi:hypothetical protein